MGDPIKLMFLLRKSLSAIPVLLKNVPLTTGKAG
jgi:hypothetical protein